MIDHDWFATVRCLSGASLGNDELGRLAQVLGEEEEVLPYLLLRTDAFSTWPKAREAMRAAIKGVVRTPQAAITSHVLLTSDSRAELVEVLRAHIAGTETTPAPKADETLSSWRLQSGRALHQPQDFIDRT